MSPNGTRRLWPAVLCLAGTAAIGWLDFATGYEVSVFPLYAVPVGCIAWSQGAVAAVLLALASGGVWCWADLASGHIVSAPWIEWVNGGCRAVVFLAAGLAIVHFRRTLERTERRARPLAGVIPICSHCRRIASAGGFWCDCETFLREHTLAQPVVKVCPDCARTLYAARPGASAETGRPPGAP